MSLALITTSPLVSVSNVPWDTSKRTLGTSIALLAMWTKARHILGQSNGLPVLVCTCILVYDLWKPMNNIDIERVLNKQIFVYSHMHCFLCLKGKNLFFCPNSHIVSFELNLKTVKKHSLLSQKGVGIVYHCDWAKITTLHWLNWLFFLGIFKQFMLI